MDAILGAVLRSGDISSNIIGKFMRDNKSYVVARALTRVIISSPHLHSQDSAKVEREVSGNEFLESHFKDLLQ